MVTVDTNTLVDSEDEALGVETSRALFVLNWLLTHVLLVIGLMSVFLAS